jgi:glycine cleavage system T protein (aminomethyltransferase)
MTAPQPATELRRTPLHALHVSAGARMVGFAGYEMPVHYPAGIIKEHLHTRAAVSLFDVSHMGQVKLRPRSGRLADAARALETLVPADIVGLAPNRQRYTFFTTETGGILDDLMVSNAGDYLALVVNAAGKAADEAHLGTHLSDSCIIEPLLERALIALQGPMAEGVLWPFAPDVHGMRFMDARSVILFGDTCTISRSGYTGEDGFEISVAAGNVETVCRRLLEGTSVRLAGLGARDSLRLEAGLCLYGSDLDPTTTPVEATLEWAIPNVRRAGGARAGGFPGTDVILAQLSEGAPRRRVGFKPEGRAPVRAGAPLYRTEGDETSIGVVTSGGFGVSLGAPIAVGYVPTALSCPGGQLFTELRGKRLAMQVCELPFVPHRYKRT